MSTLPDLVRPTLWRLGYRLWWGWVELVEVKGQYAEDALEAFQQQTQRSPEQICRAEFFSLSKQSWQSLSDQDLQAAIVLAGGSE